MRKITRKILMILGILLPISLFLAGCASSNRLTIPNDFPTTIPIYPGEIIVSTATGQSNQRTWVVEVLVDDLENARLKSIADLKKANFVIQEEFGIGSNEYLSTLKGSAFTIRLKVYLESGTGQKEIMYIVTHS